MKSDKDNAGSQSYKGWIARLFSGKSKDSPNKSKD